VAEIEENQLNAMAPVVETHIYVIAIVIKEQAASDQNGRPLSSILPKIRGIMPIFAIAVWILDAMNSDSEPIPQRQINRTTLMICGSTGIPAYPMAITNGDAVTLLVPRSNGSV
jgi:hypothetical protein